MRKVKILTLATLGILLIASVGFAASDSSSISINAYRDVVFQNSLNNFGGDANNPRNTETHYSNTLIIDYFFNANSTVTVDATAFTSNGHTLDTEWAFVSVGAGPAWYGSNGTKIGDYGATSEHPDDSRNTFGQDLSWVNDAIWVDPGAGSSTLSNHDSNADGTYGDGQAYSNARVRINRNGLGDLPGNYTATINITISSGLS